MQEASHSLAVSFQKCGNDSENQWTQPAGSQQVQRIWRLLRTSPPRRASCSLQETLGLRFHPPTFANKLLAVLHFPSGESVLTYLDIYLAPSHLLLLTAPYLKKERKKGGRERRGEGGEEKVRKEGKILKCYLKSLLQNGLHQPEWWTLSGFFRITCPQRFLVRFLGLLLPVEI